MSADTTSPKLEQQNSPPPDPSPPPPPPPPTTTDTAPVTDTGSTGKRRTSNIRGKFTNSNGSHSNHGGGPPQRISIENLEFMEQDQRQKELEAKVERHKSKKRLQRHRRNESFGKTPSICEDGQADTNSQEWLIAMNNNENSATSLHFTGTNDSEEHNENLNPPQQQPQLLPYQPHKGHSYMVPLQDSSSSALQLPPPPAGATSTIDGYASYNAAGMTTTTTTTSTNYYSEYRKHRRSPSATSSQGTPPPPNAPVHPLKAGPQQQQQQQGYPEFDDEYASLLQQNFSITSGYGATGAHSGYGATGTHHSSSSPLPPSGRSTSPLPQYPPRKGSRDYPPPQFQQQHHKSASMPNYGAVVGGPPRSRTSSDASGGGLPPPPPSNFHLRQSSGLHIHRRSHSDNYAKMAFQQQYPYGQQSQPHPLLRNNNNNGNKSPRMAGPRTTQGGGPPRQQQYMDPKMTSSPGHRRVRSSGMAGIHSGQQQQQTLTPSLSSGNLLPMGAASPASSRRGSAGGHHRRSSSLASYSSNAGVSVQSEASFLSVVSDIRRSSFYSGYNENSGQMEMHYPKENIHLSTSKGLTPGKIYAAEVDTEAFEEYHRQAEEAMWEDEDMYNLDFHKCACQCTACYHGCTGHENNHKSRKPRDPFQALPTTTFTLAVEENLYRRVLDEISQASSMPCGLFYCGHHEDVDHPSIKIALVIVVILFGSLGYFAYSVQLQ